MTIIKKFGLMLLLASFLTPGSALASSEDFTIWLVRHTEKGDDHLKDPNLTKAGKDQAESLKSRLQNKGIKAIYATEFKRTQQTAAPLAKALNLEVQAYDPKKLEELAKSLVAKGENALVVGHSNTTPEMAWLLSGEYQQDIDEEEFNRILIAVKPKHKTASLLSIKESPVNAENIVAPVINVQAIHSFSSEFNMLFNKEKIGTAKQTVLVNGETISMQEETVVTPFNIDATINATANKADFAPLSMSMEGKMGVPAAIDFKWQSSQPDSSKVAGFTDMVRSKYKQQGKIEFEDDYNLNMIERTSAIMLVPFFKQDKSFRFEWFNTYDAASREIQFIPLGEETVTVPAGTFNTRKVKLLGGAPSQVFYISKENKPKVVKIEVVKMPWTYELQSWQAK